MISKIINKILFIYYILFFIYGFRSKLILIINSIIIFSQRIHKMKPASFSVWIKDNNQKTKVSFTGTIDELHALTEIFIEKCYKPKNNPRVILDLGANIGIASIWFKLNYPESIIHAYEPNPEMYEILVNNISKFKNVYCFNKAISNQRTKINFNISKRSFSSSVYSFNDSQKIIVDAVTIDDAIDKIGGSVDLMKIDIEGSEFTAIEVSKMMHKIEEIVGEIHPEKANKKIDDVNILIEKISNTHILDKMDNNTKSIFHAIRKNGYL